MELYIYDTCNWERKLIRSKCGAFKIIIVCICNTSDEMRRKDIDDKNSHCSLLLYILPSFSHFPSFFLIVLSLFKINVQVLLHKYSESTISIMIPLIFEQSINPNHNPSELSSRITLYIFIVPIFSQELKVGMVLIK